MPRSLIIFDNYIHGSAYQFLLDNAEQLRDLGYTQLLLELNDQHEPNAYFNYLREMLPMLTSSPAGKNIQTLINVYDKFCALGLMCRFIDPETEDTALEGDHQLELALTSNNQHAYAANYAARNLVMQQRDQVMVNAVVEAHESSRATGGVIFVVGFHHHYVVRQLQAHPRYAAQAFAYTIFHSEIIPEPDLTVIGLEPWIHLHDAAYRTQHFGSDVVQYLDPRKQSFEMIKAILQLTATKDCLPGSPSLAAVFNKKTQLPFIFSHDEQCIVSAAVQVSHEEEVSVVSKLKNLFPGLQFFSQRIPGTQQTEIRVPGTNLVDQRSCLN